MANSARIPGWHVAIVISATILCGLSGCGLDAYEQRLEATRGYYAYLDKLDQNLAPPWRYPPVESLRVPKQFQEIPAPQAITNSEGRLEMPEVDPRQPTFLRSPIEGLIGAWKAPVDNQGAAADAYIYVATNAQLFLASRATDALSFSKDLPDNLESSLQTEAKPEAAAMFPVGHTYLPRISFDKKSFRPELPLQDVLYDVEFYAAQNGDNQVAIIIFLPRTMDPQTRIAERIPLMLESLQISMGRPQTASGGGAPKAGAPASGGGF